MSLGDVKRGGCIAHHATPAREASGAKKQRGGSKDMEFGCLAQDVVRGR